MTVCHYLLKYQQYDTEKHLKIVFYLCDNVKFIKPKNRWDITGNKYYEKNFCSIMYSIVHFN